MNELLTSIVSQGGHLNLILLIGIAIFGGTAGARIFRRFHIPQVVGYVTIGILLGPVLKIINPSVVGTFEPFNAFALGIIGFLIGGELKRDIFTRFGKQVFWILLFEGLTAFLLVVLLSFLAASFFFQWHLALAIALVFGAICSATDPASTVNVLWEYKTRGPLTSMLTAIVALDDALAMFLYICSVPIAAILIGHQQSGLLRMTLLSLYDVSGSLLLGFIAGLLLRFIIKLLEDDELILIFSISSIILTIGLAKTLELDVILSSMAFGLTFVNTEPKRSSKSFDLVRRFSPPIYVLFFVLIGSRLNVSDFTAHIAIFAVAYVLGSIIGKTSGSYLGAVYSKAVPTIKKYLGFCLYQQGTIAVALLIMASQRFEGEIRDLMLSVIIIGIFTLQLVGPVFVRASVKKAGEAGLNITEDDLIKTYKVSDVMDTKMSVIAPGLSLSEVIKIVSATDSFYYPVIDADNRLLGAITLDSIRTTFATQELNDWLVALDIAVSVPVKLNPQVPLAEALDKIKYLDVDYLPVVSPDNGDKIIGVLDARAVHRRLIAEVLAKQREADSMGRPVEV
jgi:Kef-type K+ transport system membrane component KefB